ncbi:MAG: FG-GAP-like repeat-containing protein [Myxococcota bacterium]
MADAGAPDLGPPPELGPDDAGPPDLGPLDLGPEDLGPEDLGPEDLGPPDMELPPLRDPRFVDVSAVAGFDHDQDPNIPGTCTDPRGLCGEGWQTGGAAAGDVDGDGWPDVYFTVMGGQDRLYLNRRDGTFEDVSEAWGITLFNSTSGVAMHDLDRDGDLDIYVNSYGSTRHYYYENVGGRFVERGLFYDATPPLRRYYQGQSVGFGDVDGDGWADLYSVEWLFDYFGTGTPPSETMLLRNELDAARPRFVNVTDEAGVGADGWPTTHGQVGTFALTPVFTDLDDDGLQDLYVAADFGASKLFWNEGDGTFFDGTELAEVNQATNAMGVAVGDIDLDGDLDLYVTSIAWQEEEDKAFDDRGNRLYLNQGDRRFTEEAFDRGLHWGHWGWGVAFVDLDHDGDPDVVSTSGYNARPDGRELYYENDGTAHFTERGAEVGFGEWHEGRALVLLDYDRDGDSDVLVVRYDDAPLLYRNDLPRRTHWVRVRVFDERGADALGARVIVRRGDDFWLHEVRASGAFNASHEPWIDVGLGPVDGTPCTVSVEVNFPDGEFQRETVACNDWHEFHAAE